MDDQGNVIDGTARARQWRGSRREAPPGEGLERRSEAPKGFASSLLVPAEMVHDPAAVRASERQPSVGEVNGDQAADRARVAPGRPPVEGQEHRNPFLVSPDATDRAVDTSTRRWTSWIWIGRRGRGTLQRDTLTSRRGRRAAGLLIAGAMTASLLAAGAIALTSHATPPATTPLISAAAGLRPVILIGIGSAARRMSDVGTLRHHQPAPPPSHGSRRAAHQAEHPAKATGTQSVVVAQDSAAITDTASQPAVSVRYVPVTSVPTSTTHTDEIRTSETRASNSAPSNPPAGPTGPSAILGPGHCSC